MKKITLWLFALFSCWQMSGQASSYSFSHQVGAFTENSPSATTISGVRADTFISSAQPIGFDFVYEGITYTQFKMSSNGFISFNTTGTSALTGNDFTTANAASRPIIAPLWDDLDGGDISSSLASYEVTGSAPNRVLTIEWKNWQWNYTATTSPTISFQVKLYETTNIIEFVYRQDSGAVSSGSASIGVGSATGSGSGSYLNLTSVTTPAVSSSTSVTNISTKPVTGQIYRFTPPTPCNGEPFGGTASPALQTLLSGLVPATITVSGQTTGVSSLLYQWEESTDGSVWNNVTGGTGANTLAYTPPAYAGTEIMYRLKITCQTTDETGYSTVATLTSCSAIATFPFVETFNTDSISKTCWTVIDVNGDGDFWNLNGTIIPRTGQSAQLYTDGNTNNNDYLITPQLDLGANPKRLKFWVRHRSNDEPENLNVRISTTGRAIADFSTVLLTLSTTQLTTTYTEYVVDLTDYVDTPVYIAFAREDAPANGWYLAIDDVTVEDQPLCPDQTGLVVANITATGADFSWDDMSTNGASGYEYAITTSATPPASGTATALTFYESSDLDPQTQYYLHVRATCDGGDFGNWATSAPFTTLCLSEVAPTVVQTFATYLPSCWREATGALTSSSTLTNADGAWISYQFAGVSTSNLGTKINLYGGSTATPDNDWIISNQIDLGSTPGLYRVKYKSALTSYNGTTAQTSLGTHIVRVVVSTDGGTTWSDSNVIKTYSGTYTPSEYDVINLTGYSGVVRIGFVATTSSLSPDIDFHIDDFVVEELPACPDQTGLVVANITATGADFSWDDMSANGASGYEYAITTSATPPTSGTATALTFYESSDLDPQTQYYLHVRATCDGGNFGNWATSASFTTDCAPITSLPHLETFTTFMPACWLRGTNGDLASGPTAFGTSTWVADGPGNVGTTGAIRVNLDATGGNDWIISPMFEIPATGYELRFEVSAHQWNSTGAPTTPWEDSDIVEVLVSSGTTNWTVLYTYDSSNVPSNVPTFNTPIDLSAYANQTVRFAFRAFEGLDNERDIEFIVDNFEIRETPACSDQTGLVIGNISATGAEMSWDDMNVDGYEYAVTTSATPPLSGTFTTATFYEAINNLDPLTVYYLHVRTDCGNGNFGVWVSASFKTACLPPNITGTTPGAVCGQGSVELSATADAGTIAWYAAQTGGPKLGEGGTFTTPQIATTTSYWVETKTGDSLVLGPVSPTAQGGTIATQTIAWNVNFTVNESTTLSSIDVFPLTAGQTGNIQLRQGSGTTVIATVPYTTSVSGGATAQTVELNFELEPGTYNLYPTLPTSGISRNTSGAVYPYSSSVASITGNGFDNTYFMGFYNWVFGTGCASPRTEVIATVTTAQPLTLDATSAEICQEENSNAITITSNVADYDTYVWEPSTGVSGNENTGWTFNPTVTTAYTLTASQTSGAECVTTTTFTVNVNQKPSDIEDAVFTTCEDNIIQLSVDGGVLSSNVTSGTGTLLSATNSTGATLGPNPLQTYYGNTKQQWLYTASELTALGFTNGSSVNSFSLNLSQANNYVLNNLVVKMKNSSISQFATTSSWESDMTVVKASSSHTTVSGLNNFVLDTPFIWDGSSSLVIEINYKNNNGGGATADYTRAYYSNTSFNSTIFYRYDNTAQDANTYTGTATAILTQRNNVVFNVSLPTDMTWSPATDLYTDSSATTPYVSGDLVSVVYFKSSSIGDKIYNVTSVSSSGCESTGTVTVTVNETPAAPAALSPQTLNEGQTLADLTVTAIGDLTWYSDAGLTTQISSTTEAVDGTTYYVTQTVGSCTSDATPITVDVNLGNGNFDNVTFKVYPNPTKNILNISCNQDISTIEVYNMVGQRVNNMVLNANAGQIDMSNLASGAYFVKVTSNNATKTVKVIKE